MHIIVNRCRSQDLINFLFSLYTFILFLNFILLSTFFFINFLLFSLLLFLLLSLWNFSLFHPLYTHMCWKTLSWIICEVHWIMFVSLRRLKMNFHLFIFIHYFFETLFKALFKHDAFWWWEIFYKRKRKIRKLNFQTHFFEKNFFILQSIFYYFLCERENFLLLVKIYFVLLPFMHFLHSLFDWKSFCLLLSNLNSICKISWKIIKYEAICCVSFWLSEIWS